MLKENNIAVRTQGSGCLGAFMCLLTVLLLTAPSCVSEADEVPLLREYNGQECAPQGTQRRVCVHVANNERESIHDANLMIFNAFGQLEESRFVVMPKEGGPLNFEVNLFSGARYSFYVVMNFGYRIEPYDIDELKDLRLYLEYPGEMVFGMPMAGALEDILFREDSIVCVDLSRLFCAIDLRIDRSALDPEVNLNLETIRICSSPRFVKVFGQSEPLSPDDCFSYGQNYSQVSFPQLNYLKTLKTQAFRMFILENPGGGEDSALNPYLELRFSYISPSARTASGKYLIYRVPVSDDMVERGHVLSLTVAPKGSGLGDGRDTWKIDSSEIIF